MDGELRDKLEEAYIVLEQAHSLAGEKEKEKIDILLDELSEIFENE